MAFWGEFNRRFRQLTEGHTQAEVAELLDISQGYVSRLGVDARPSRRLVQRLAEKFRVDEGEWLRLAGYETELTEEERLARVATCAAEEALRRAGLVPITGSQRLIEGLQHLNQRYHRPIPVDFSQGFQGELTVERAEALLADLEEQLRQRLI